MEDWSQETGRSRWEKKWVPKVEVVVRQGPPIPGVFGNTGLSLLPLLCPWDQAFSSHLQGDLIYMAG